MSLFSVAMDMFTPQHFAGPDVLFSTIFAGVIILNLLLTGLAIAGLIAGLVSLSRHRQLLGGSELALWVAIVVLASLIGAIAWFTIGRTRAREIAHAAAPETPPASSD